MQDVTSEPKWKRITGWKRLAARALAEVQFAQNAFNRKADWLPEEI